MATNVIKVPCIEVQQPIGPFYIGRIDSRDLVEIAYSDVRRIENRDLERVLGIQRPLSMERVEELKQYVTSLDASFPTSIILAIQSEHVEYDQDSQSMRIQRRQNVAKIIDGQHRIAGLEGYDGRTFQLNVTIFVDMELEDQALLFATINLKQTRVNKSLAYDLWEFATGRGPQKTCHNIVKLLNTKKGSPFEEKVKILGRATGSERETLTQAAFVDRLMPYISTNPMEDRNKLKARQKLSYVDAGEEKRQRLIFRNMFIDERDAEITKVLWNYFAAVATKWPRAWNEKQTGNLLNRTAGFGGLMLFLPSAYYHAGKPGELVSTQRFQPIFQSIPLNDADFTRDTISLGASGEKELFRFFIQHSKLEEV